MISTIRTSIKKYFLEEDSNLVFFSKTSPSFDKICSRDGIHLYIHIPFCENLCPYCPYNKIKYDRSLVEPYKEAVLHEIKLYKSKLPDLEILSIYVGGGTPTLLIDELNDILNSVRNNFKVSGSLCIELSPNNVNSEIVEKLKNMNFSLVSLGVQSFHSHHLSFIGRKYEPSTINDALKKLLSGGFESVNIDLMFALPKQNVNDLKVDIDQAVQLGVNQVTAYPLFTFPYTSVGKYLKLKKTKMPNIIQRRKQYRFIHSYMEKQDFNRESVWSFKKGGAPRYSSVTRDNYIGLGAGAGSYQVDGFYLNTFSVEEYIKKCSASKFPTALHLPFTSKVNNYFWLYWRFYDTKISKNELMSRFLNNDKKIRILFKILCFFNFVKQDENNYILTENGSFWVHLLQNFFSLNYINKIWSVAKKAPFPEKVEL